MANHRYTAHVSWDCDGDFAANTYSRGHVWAFDGGIKVPASASPTVVPLPHSVEAAVDPEEAFIAAGTCARVDERQRRFSAAARVDERQRRRHEG